MRKDSEKMYLCVYQNEHLNTFINNSRVYSVPRSYLENILYRGMVNFEIYIYQDASFSPKNFSTKQSLR